MNGAFVEFAYIAAAVLFIFGLKMLGAARTARRGNAVSAAGMLIAIAATLGVSGVVSYPLLFAGLALGGALGAVAARRVHMTAMPQMVALFNGFGGLASLLVGWAEYHRALRVEQLALPPFTAVSIYLAALIGGVTFTGSIVAYAKLAEIIPGRPLLFRGQKALNAALLAAALVLLAIGGAAPESTYGLFLVAAALAFALGVLAVIPIGGADMPVVISLLNSYSGLAACAAGFIIQNTVLVVAGCLVGASGLILTQIMCKAMNRSLGNVLFSGFGAAPAAGAAGAPRRDVQPITAEDAYYLLEAARSVVIVPGYGMAVAQAQHVVRELGDLLEARGGDVAYAIHPVAGRMPGHMNVLLAEANVPYEKLVEPGDVNPLMSAVDVVLVIGANDVVNPAAREDPASPIYGMPIIHADEAKACIVLKRSMASGFAGIDNPLFFKDNARMLFGDAKASVAALANQLKETENP
ncbi:MAG: NAD(P)(+) transhydrogenase (Re/Si-specific) subunit beta [Spartobacteria bacterium]|nr:NAD(P)(+) transhydrogenase (Re/Si-specific) subunit beta [Spartobacteria bacterium]